jgi:hypothetical protein
MTLAQLAQLIGQQGNLSIDGLEVSVKIVNIKQAYGNTRYEVTPVSGSGIITVDSGRVRING